MTACQCTHEQGDSDCEKHPRCPNCGESVESMRLVAGYRAVESALNDANVAVGDLVEEPRPHGITHAYPVNTP